MQHHAEKQPRRLFSLDLLRGIDMFYLAVVSTILPSVFKALEFSPEWQRFFCSHPWEGFTLYDLIMPLFIFMCGAAIPFSLGRRLVAGKPGPGYWRHVWSRVIMLWLLGMLAQGGLATLNIHKISFYSNTLQTIAVGYLVAAYLITFRSWKVRIVVPVILAAAYGLIVHFCGDYTKEGNITQIVELKILRAIMPADNEQIGYVVKYGYNWYLPSMMFPVITMAGYFATEILRRSDLGEWRRATWLLAYGLASLALGWVLAFFGVKMVKHFFSVSFTFQAIGWSVLLLALLYVLTDIWKLRRGTGILILFGQFALTAYLCESVFRGVCFSASERLFSGVCRFFDPKWSDTVLAIGFGLVVIAVVAVRRQLAMAKRLQKSQGSEISCK